MKDDRVLGWTGVSGGEVEGGGGLSLRTDVRGFVFYFPIPFVMFIVRSPAPSYCNRNTDQYIGSHSRLFSSIPATVRGLYILSLKGFRLFLSGRLP